MKAFVSVCLLIVGLIHLLPVTGVIGSERLLTLYGVALTDPNHLILMRHRAVLFGLLGAFMIWAAFRPVLQPAAFVLAFVSVISFLWLAWSTDRYNAELARVVFADIIALVMLLAAVIVRFIDAGRSTP